MEADLKIYSVFVGGGEVNDYYLTKAKARELAEEYIKEGYTDVAVLKMK